MNQSKTDATAKRSRRRRKGKAATTRLDDFWGDATALPSPPHTVRITKDPAAVMRSIGRPPLSGHEVIAEHYFEAVCQRAVALASALAAAAELVDPDEL